MFQKFANYHLEKAKYEIIENGKTYYGEIPKIKGVWATGKNLEECRNNLLDVLEGWVILRLQKNLPVPGLQTEIKKINLPQVAYA
ncbi:MAG: type II toxin-antitoxin system HicB family antitoxin [bacterium]|nr:type II toxin-antitoxin system HicB family antitoxin [bacterium]